VAFAKAYFYAMPTYEYVCTECEHEFEAFQSMKDAPLTNCPACEQPKVKRRVGGGAGLIFKGSGFYITDYKKKPSSGEGGGAKTEPSSTPAKTESKPAAAK
jgi:putative FmdB family regulatory protein